MKTPNSESFHNILVGGLESAPTAPKPRPTDSIFGRVRKVLSGAIEWVVKGTSEGAIKAWDAIRAKYPAKGNEPEHMNHPPLVPDKPGEWIDHHPDTPMSKLEADGSVSGGTMGKFSVDPKDPSKGFTPERQALHDKIIKHFTSHVKSTDHPHAILMMGAPASGKSSMIRDIDDSDMVRVDADAIKDHFPEYQKGVKAGAKDIAQVVHEESSHLAKKIRDHAIENKKNFIFDGTGRNDKTYKQIIDRIHDKGYHATVLMPDLDHEEGLRRAKDRANKSGRYVTDDFVKQAYKEIPGKFEGIAKKADSFVLFNARTKKGEAPAPVWTKIDGKETIHDPEFVQKFKEKHTSGS